MSNTVISAEDRQAAIKAAYDEATGTPLETPDAPPDAVLRSEHTEWRINGLQTEEGEIIAQIVFTQTRATDGGDVTEDFTIHFQSEGLKSLVTQLAGTVVQMESHGRPKLLVPGVEVPGFARASGGYL